jgi:hypothetical protein
MVGDLGRFKRGKAAVRARGNAALSVRECVHTALSVGKRALG